MKLFLVNVLIFLLVESSTGQDLIKAFYEYSEACGGGEQVMRMPGKWEKREDASPFPDRSFPRSQMPQVRERIDKIASFFKEAITDVSGMKAGWYRYISGNSYVTNGPLPYDFTSLYLNYYCNTNAKKIELSGETGTWAYVFVNHWSWLCDKVATWDINNDSNMVAIFSLAPKVGAWKGMNLYQPRSHSNALAVVIGHDKKLPWHTLTRRQYLTGLRNYMANNLKTSLAGYEDREKKFQENIDATYKKLRPEQAAEIIPKLEKQLEDYRQKKPGYIASTKKYYTDKLRPIEEYLQSASEDDLNMPAFLNTSNSLEFKGEFSDEAKGGTRLIAFTTRYFKPGLPQYAPQFMVLYWRWDDNPISLNFKRQFEQNFPIEKLKAMIDQ